MEHILAAAPALPWSAWGFRSLQWQDAGEPDVAIDRDGLPTMQTLARVQLASGVIVRRMLGGHSMRVARPTPFGLAAFGGYLAKYWAALPWLGDEVCLTNCADDGPNGVRATVVGRSRNDILRHPTQALILTAGNAAESSGLDGSVAPHLPWGQFMLHDAVWTGERPLRVEVWSLGAGGMRGGTTIACRDGTQIPLVE